MAPIRKSRISSQCAVATAVATVFFASIAAAAPAARAPTYDRAAWRLDFKQLKAELQREYVNLAWMGSPQSGVDLPRLDQHARMGLAAAQTDDEARQVILDFVAGFHDGHLSNRPSLIAPIGPVEPEPPPPVLDENDPLSGCAAIGFNIGGTTAFSLPFESLPGFVLTADGQDKPFRTGLALSPNGQRIGVLRIQSFRVTSYPGACLSAWSALKSEGAPIKRRTLARRAQALWFAALGDRLKELQHQNVAAVLVDVGGNGGGDDSGDWMPRMFTNKPVYSARMKMVAAPSAAAYFDEQIEAMDEGLDSKPSPEAKAALMESKAFFLHQKAAQVGAGCDLSWVWREQRPWRADACNNLIDAGFASGAKANLPKGAYGDVDIAALLWWPATIEDHFGAWAGPAYVLTDTRTFSSAEMFTAVMKDNAIGRTIGLRTGGDGCGFMGEAKSIALAHSGLRFRVPNCLRLRADGSDEVAGIAPDIALPPVNGESDRARAARALKTIAAELEGGAN